MSRRQSVLTFNHISTTTPCNFYSKSQQCVITIIILIEIRDICCMYEKKRSKFNLSKITQISSNVLCCFELCIQCLKDFPYLKTIIKKFVMLHFKRYYIKFSCNNKKWYEKNAEKETFTTVNRFIFIFMILWIALVLDSLYFFYYFDKTE